LKISEFQEERNFFSTWKKRLRMEFQITVVEEFAVVIDTTGETKNIT